MLAVGCSDDSTSPPPNESPTITFTYAKIVAEKNKDIPLTVDVSDPDNVENPGTDVLTVNWTVSAGQIVSGQGTPDLTWRSPNSIENVTVTATVTDGKGGSATTGPQIVRTGTVLTSAPSSIALANSPYIIRPAVQNFTVIGATTIAAGVELYMDKDVLVNVLGILAVNGTAAEPVLFTTNTRNSSPGEWKGFQAAGTEQNVATIQLSNAVVEKSRQGVQAALYSSVRLSHCLVQQNTESAVKVTGGATVRVLGCTLIDNDQAAILVEVPVTPTNPLILHIIGNKITTNGTAFNDAYGAIDLGLNDPNGLQTVIIQENDISRNFYVGILFREESIPTITDNAIFANDFGGGPPAKNIRLEPPFNSPQPTIDATNNFWSLNTADEIKQTIVDKDDNGTISTEVVVDPWRTTCPADTFPFAGEIGCP